CPQCRSENFEFKNHRRFECFNCGMEFYQNIATAVAIIIEKDNKILFTVRNNDPKKGLLGLPGGFVDPDETAEESAARETKEEINLDIAPHEFTYIESQPNDYEYKGFPYKTEDLIFTADFPKQAEIKIEEEEIYAVKWMDKADIDVDEIAFKSLKKAMKAYGKSS